MQTFPNAQLDSALSPGRERFIRPIVEVDWAKNASWSGPASRLADEIQDLTIQDQTDAALPDEVNGVASASSTLATIVLHGADPVTGLPFWRLFSPFLSSGPFLGKDLSGAAIKISARVENTSQTPTRQFTGWVQSVTPDRAAGTVTITAANHLHLLGKTVTLPRWSRNIPVDVPTLPTNGLWDTPDEDRRENAPLSFAWLFQYIMRECNALPGPNYRHGCIWYSSGYGGMIPERGRYTDINVARSYQNQGRMAYFPPQNWLDNNRSVLSWSELGFPSWFAWNYTSEAYNDIYSQSGTTELVTNTGPRWANGAAWVRPDGALMADFSFKQELWLDTKGAILSGPDIPEADAAVIRMSCNSSSSQLRIRGQGSGAATVSHTVGTGLPPNVLTYVSWEVDLLNPQNARVWYNNVLQTSTVAGSLNTWPVTNVQPEGVTNRARVWGRAFGYANAELWMEAAASPNNSRIPTWSNTDYQRKDFAIVSAGIDQPYIYVDAKQYEGSTGAPWLPAVTWIPIRQDYSAWELLKELCAAAQATMFIDEYGGLRIIPQVVMKILESRATDPTTFPRETITADGLSGLSVRSNFDGVRNALRYGYRVGRSLLTTVFEAADASSFTIAGRPGGVGTERVQVFEFSATNETINTTKTTNPLTRWPNTLPPERWGQEGVMFASYFGWPPLDLVVPDIDADVRVVDTGRQDRIRLVISSRDPNRIFTARGALTESEYASGVRRAPTQPALRVRGLRLVLDDPGYDQLGDGDRVLDLPVTEWHSCPWSFTRTYFELLERAKRYVPIADNLVVPGDPRRQLYDLITLKDDDGIGSAAVAQIIGRTTRYSANDGFTQTLSVRLLSVPGEWLLGVDGFSELGVTTTLG